MPAAEEDLSPKGEKMPPGKFHTLAQPSVTAREEQPHHQYRSRSNTELLEHAMYSNTTQDYRYKPNMPDPRASASNWKQ